MTWLEFICSVLGEVSGVYCGLCILLRQLEVEGSADLVTTAQKLRQKRPAIITNKVYIQLYIIMLFTAKDGDSIIVSLSLSLTLSHTSTGLLQVHV